MTTSPPKTVILWVHPRSTSSMFECAVLQLEDFRVLHEPMGDAHYFGPERVSRRYSPEQCDNDFAHFKDSTYKKTWDNLVHNREDGPARTFSKDMAQYIFSPPSSSVTSVPSFPKSSPEDDGNPTLIPSSILLDPSIQHTFLIRSPVKAVPSYHRLCYPGSPTGFEYWDPEEAGYTELRQLYQFLKEKKGEEEGLIVLESEDLLKEPEKVMRRWCEATQIPFEAKMLEWDEGTREHFKKWPGFHEAAEGSSGIGKGLKDELKTPCNYTTTTNEERTESPSKKAPAGGAPKILPAEVQACIDANMADYQYLLERCSRL